MSEIKVNSIKGVGASTAAITVNNTDGTCTANITNNLSNRNKVINGAMQVAARGTSFSPNSTAQIYTLDRFQHVATGGAAFDSTVTQDSSAPVGFSKSYKVTPDAADTPSGGGNACIRTKIEGQDVQDLAYGSSDAKKVTVSFYAKSASQNNGHQYTFQLRHFATDGTQRSINAPFTITSSFQRFTFSFVGDTAVDIINSSNLGMELDWQLAAGPDDISSQQTTWVTTNLFTCVTGQSNFLDNTNNEFYFTGVQLEVDHTGSGVATDFEHRSFGQELALCQRYFERIVVDDSEIFFFGVNQFGSAGRIPLTFKVTKRAIPTVTIDNATFNYYAVQGSGSNGSASFTVNSYSTDTMGISSSGAGANTSWWTAKNADGYVDASAEL
jgi:hypothetical protein